MPAAPASRTRPLALITLASLIASGLLCAQDTPSPPQPSEDHRQIVLAGKIGEKAAVRAIITTTPNELGSSQLHGTYHYLSQKKTLHLWGNLEGDQASLEEGARRYAEDVTGRFNGTWSFGDEPGKTTFKGTWTSADQKRKLPFTLTEVQDPDIPGLDFFVFAEEYARRSGSQVMHREQALIFPQLRGKGKAIKQVNGYIRHLALQLVDDTEDEPAPDAAPPSLKTLEKAVRAPLPDDKELEDLEIGHFASLTYEETFEVLLNENKLLSLRLFHSEYTGGAHPNYGASHVTFDLTTGDELTLDDLLKPGWRDIVTQLAEASIREQHGLKPNAPLNAEGPLFENAFELNDNWFLTAEGLGFSYDPYEIGPYAAGFIEPVIPFTQLKALIRPNSPLNRLVGE
jgi:hypothetical protein